MNRARNNGAVPRVTISIIANMTSMPCHLWCKLFAGEAMTYLVLDIIEGTDGRLDIK